jgi:arylsulfatase A-like enzyme
MGLARGAHEQRATAPGERLCTPGASPNLLVLLRDAPDPAAVPPGQDDPGDLGAPGSDRAHGVVTGSVMELVAAAPRCDGMETRSAEMLARILRGNGYATGAFGQWHQTPHPEQPVGPWAAWEEGEAFDAFYGFLGAAADPATSALAHCSTFVDPPRTEQEHCVVSEASVDRAITWVEEVRRADGDRAWLTVLSFAVAPDASGAAALARHTDAQVRRFLDHLARTGQIQDTLVL